MAQMSRKRLKVSVAHKNGQHFGHLQVGGKVHSVRVRKARGGGVTVAKQTKTLKRSAIGTQHITTRHKSYSMPKFGSGHSSNQSHYARGARKH